MGNRVISTFTTEYKSKDMIRANPILSLSGKTVDEKMGNMKRRIPTLKRTSI
jgi:hypothetical protein